MLEYLAWIPLLAAGISAAGSLAGGLLSSQGSSAQNAASLQMAREQMQFSDAQAQRQMDFQKEMSNTAYQRAMADMRSAGLNPILAYQQGGAGTPPGAQGASAGATFQNAMEGMGQGVSSASKAGQQYLDMKNVMAQTASTATQADLNTANTDLSKTHAIKNMQETSTSAAAEARTKAETANIIASADNPAAIRALMKGQETSAYASAGLSNEQRKQLKAYGPHWSGQIAGSVERLIDRFRGAKLPDGAAPSGLGGTSYTPLTIDMYRRK